ncbi:MAG: hypothetical protein U5K74_08995 [Gemmatimonadaceae bacterium]|nr:hypothetical protein [Gemmatimonadaceae bacterium]
MFCTSTMIAEAGSTLLISSTARAIIIAEPPAPPADSGNSMPIRPISKYFAMTAGSIFPASSIARTRGATSSAANAATASRNMVSSSESWVSAGRAVGLSVIDMYGVRVTVWSCG